MSLNKMEKLKQKVAQCAPFGYKLQYYTFSKEHAYNLAVDYVLARRSLAQINLEYHQRLLSRSWLPVEGLDMPRPEQTIAA